jgi:NADH-quinone oxidoreductase subunit A
MDRFGKLFTSTLEGNAMGWVGVLIMIALATGFALVMIGLSMLVGPRNPTPEKLAPYECGMPAVGDARERQSVKFYLVAMIFLLFDIEVAFLYPWAMALRDLGWTGFIQIVTFFLILVVGYIYVWRKGILDWGPVARPARESRPTPVIEANADLEGRLHGRSVA